MSVHELKGQIAALSSSELRELAVYLGQLRQQSDQAYHDLISARLDDKDPAKWVTPEEFERRLDQE